MTVRYSLAFLSFPALLLFGCAPSGSDDLAQWVEEQRAGVTARVPQLSEPKTFAPEAYKPAGLLDPFNQTKLTQELRRELNAATDSRLIAPEMARHKEPLEAFPLDSIAMVGSLNKSGSPAALLLVGNLLYQVQVGNFLGQNYGKILSISETQIQLREIVQDAVGEWSERISLLELQEGKK